MNVITHNRNPLSFVKCKCATPTGNQTFVYKANKSRHVFLNSVKNAPFFFLSSVCGSVSADKSQPGGGTDVALTSIWASCPCAASHGRCSMKDAPHSGPPHSEGPLSRKRGLPASVSSRRHTESPRCCFHSYSGGVFFSWGQLSDGTSGFTRGASSLFQHPARSMTIPHARPL